MFSVGQRVVCVNDSFPGPVLKVYSQLPVKGVTYTVSAVFVGRGKLLGASPGASDGEIGILLKELLNPRDPLNKHGLELGFNSERFAPLDEMPMDPMEEPVHETAFA